MASYHWVANKDITVAHGVRRKEGEHVPEVDDWKDPEHWERAKHIRKVAGPAPGMPGGNGCLRHDMVDGACSVCGWATPAPKVVPEPVVLPDAPPEPERSEEPVIELTDDEVLSVDDSISPSPFDDDVVLEAVTELVNPEPEPEVIAEPELAPKYLKGELARKRKVDLQDIALGLGLAVGDSTKAQIITAIMEAQGA